jgi:hypothetical protein
MLVDNYLFFSEARTHRRLRALAKVTFHRPAPHPSYARDSSSDCQYTQNSANPEAADTPQINFGTTTRRAQQLLALVFA